MWDDQRGRGRRPPRRRLPPEPDPGPLTASGRPESEHTWLDQDAGPVVRPYTLTGGRSRPITGGLSLMTHVEALYAPEADLVHLQPEHRAILNLTRTALSMAELAARLDLPVGVVRVLIGDLLQESLVSTFESDSAINPPDDSILQAVIDGLRAL
jgi:DNA-directed RNA polymerase specialized sigma24 family protein